MVNQEWYPEYIFQYDEAVPFSIPRTLQAESCELKAERRTPTNTSGRAPPEQKQ